ncbi:MAG: hypothetical protein ACKVVP_23310 [Chloroflexota bacterium]
MATLYLLFLPNGDYKLRELLFNRRCDTLAYRPGGLSSEIREKSVKAGRKCEGGSLTRSYWSDKNRGATLGSAQRTRN